MPAVEALRAKVVEQLRADADAHEAGRFDAVGRRFDALEHALPRDDAPGLAAVRTALAFWDAWIHARNHGWRGTQPFAQDEWPALARAVADDLAAGREFTDPRVRAGFDSATEHPADSRQRTLTDRLRGRDAGRPSV